MDLLATVRKEGSRGGRGEFKWSDVESSGHRQNYLGHSLMAPVGRWQKGRDLTWYAKDGTDEKDGENAAEKAARERKEEIQRVKEAEEDALARALGLPVAPRNNPNDEALGDRREMNKILKEATGVEESTNDRGLGYGSRGGPFSQSGETSERIHGNAEQQDRELQYALKEYQRRHRDDEGNIEMIVLDGVITTIIDQDLQTNIASADVVLIHDPDPEVLIEGDPTSTRMSLVLVTKIGNNNDIGPMWVLRGGLETERTRGMQANNV